MAKYMSEARRKKNRRRKILMFLSMAVFVAVVSTGMVKIFEHFSADRRSALPEGYTLQHPNTNITKQFDDWDSYTGEVQQTINLVDDYMPEMKMVQVTENRKVDLSYFNDAIFVGDSLADGFRVYASGLGLGDTGAKYITRKSLSPKTFLQPGVKIDVGGGPIDPWATIEQINPKKVYVTLGTNALMAMDPETLIESYYQFIAMMKEKAPNALIYVTTITPVAAFKSFSEPRLAFDRIWQSNRLIAKMCYDEGLAMINLYDVLKDSSGYLREEISYSDGIHLTPEGYGDWLEYLTTHTVYAPNSPYIE